MPSTEVQKVDTIEKAKRSNGPRNTTTLKKVDLETAKAIAQIKERANKKTFGRKVKDSEILRLAVRLIEPEHIIQLQEATFTENDRLKILHEEYQRENGKTTFDKFIGLLIRGELKSQTANR